MQLKVDIDTKALLAALHKAPEAIAREVRPDMIDLSAEVQVQAAHNHRFTSRSGMLEASIRPKAAASGLGFSVQAGGSIAPYAAAVHQGHGSWKPDQFLFKALDAKAQRILQVVEMSIGQALRKLGFTR